MDQKSLKDVFEQYIAQKSLFKSKESLSHSFSPQEILHRDKQIREIASILATSLKGERPSNIFIYGSVGTGKTVSVRHITNELCSASQRTRVPITTLYVNCKMKKVADTEYRLLAQLTRTLGEKIPSTGLPTDDVYTRFFSKLDEREQIIILVLDEIDALVKKVGDDFMYSLTRINEDIKKAKVCIVGISNDLNFTENMDARVKSSLSEEEVIFPPYNALELKDILLQRASMAFAENALEDAVIPKCAALAAQEHGDARRALDLLRVAGEIADRENRSRVNVNDVDLARERIEKERVIEAVRAQPKHSRLTLYTILKLYRGRGELIATGNVYENYAKLASGLGLTPLTQRRVSDLISELDMLGIINAKIISKGRYGRTRNISLDLSEGIIHKIDEILSKQFA